jgi:biotin synthase
MTSEIMESPDYLKISTASAMALGLKAGRFYRGACNPCINLLLTYREGCCASCAYCGLARKRPGAYDEKSFIKVAWPSFPLKVLLNQMQERKAHIKRVCISMITNPRAVKDTVGVAEALNEGLVGIPISILISPTVIKQPDLVRFKKVGVDMIGVAVDAATERLFAQYRGNGVKGPHRWSHYWDTLRAAVGVFGRRKVGTHLIVGLGETEQEMAAIFQCVHDLGSLLHLFSFFAESNSQLQEMASPPWASYLRLQLARYVIEEDLSRQEWFHFDGNQEIAHFGLTESKLKELVTTGLPFLTSGCPDTEGNVACNRPFGNCLPGPRQWNYPYLPNQEELGLICKELGM